MDQFTKEGRKLRPRKTVSDRGSAERVDYRSSSREGSERGNYGERRSYSNGGERRSFGENRGYGENRGGYNSGERRSFSNGGERRSFGENRGYGENRGGHSYGERRSFNNGGERRSFGENRGYGENRGSHNSGERRSFSNGGERRNYGENHSYGENRGGYNSGERRSFNNGGERRSFGENRGYGENRGGGFGDRKPRFNGNGGGRNFGPKKSFGGKRQSGPAPAFNKFTDEGINKMISRRPVVNGSENVEATYETPIKDFERLNKFIANSGVCSRREADTLIQAGVVTVNGEVVTELGTKVNIHDDDVRFNGQRLKGEEKVYLIMNKPNGYVTTASDPHADKTVIDLIKNCPTRVYPVGRLDKNTTGVLMLTNDGEIAERLTHPSYDKKKIYQVALDRDLSQEDYDHILAGVELSDGEVQADELEYIDEHDKRKLGIEIHSGKNRVVRRIFETLGYNVKALDRVYFAGLTKKGLKKGEWRYLSEGEVNILKMGAYV